jgi:hypothetical protein
MTKLMTVSHVTYKKIREVMTYLFNKWTACLITAICKVLR